MEDDARSKLSSLLDSLPQSVDKVRTIEDIGVVLSAVTPASLRTIVPNLSFNTVFDCLAICNRYANRPVIMPGKMRCRLYYIDGITHHHVPNLTPHWHCHNLGHNPAKLSASLCSSRSAENESGSNSR